MGFLFSNKKNKIPEVTGLQVQTSVNSVPIAIVYGSPRMPINIIYANGFRSVKQKSGGGKGAFGGKGAVTGYKYYATFIGAMGEGEFTTVRAMFEDQNVYSPSTLPSGKNITFFSGSATQEPWSYITSKWPDDSYAYKDTAYLGFEDYLLSGGGTIPQVNVLPAAKYAGTCPLYPYTAPDSEGPFLFDADPAHCMYDFLTNVDYGVGFPESYIDYYTLFSSADATDENKGDAAVQTYCQALGFGWSVCLNNSEPASSILDRWCKNLAVAAFWNGEKLRFLPYCDTSVSTNPGYDESLAETGLMYYVPNMVPLFDLTEDDVLQAEQEDDPIVMTRVDPYDVKNTVLINFRDRYNYFNDNIVDAKDELASELYGPRIDRVGTADEFTLDIYAGNSAHMQLQRNMAVRSTVKFRLGPQWCILEPMDIITLTAPKLELDRWAMRIREIEEGDDGALSITGEECRFGSMQSTIYKKQTSFGGNVFQTNIKAPPVNKPAIFEPTADYLSVHSKPSPTVVIGVSGGPNGVFDPNWGGCQVWLSDDNVTYAQYGTITGPARTGKLESDLGAYAGALEVPDTTNTLQVTLGESHGELETVTDFQAMSGLTVCAIIDDEGTYEFVGYVNATLTGDYEYDLNKLYRGMFGTRPCAHRMGVKFVRFDSLCLELDLPTTFIGHKIYVKLPSFNIFGQGEQTIDEAVAYTYTPVGYGDTGAGNALVDAFNGGVTPIDLGSFTTTVTLDLGAATAGDCAPTNFVVDLENY